MKHIFASSVLLNGQLCYWEIDAGIDLVGGGNSPLKSPILRIYRRIARSLGGLYLIGNSVGMASQAGVIR